MFVRKLRNPSKYFPHNFTSAKNQFKADELEFELGHETPHVHNPDPVLKFGEYQGMRLSETPLNYRIWLKSQPWFKG